MICVSTYTHGFDAFSILRNHTSSSFYPNRVIFYDNHAHSDELFLLVHVRHRHGSIPTVYFVDNSIHHVLFTVI
jgi:hypothetical protein